MHPRREQTAMYASSTTVAATMAAIKACHAWGHLPTRAGSPSILAMLEGWVSQEAIPASSRRLESAIPARSRDFIPRVLRGINLKPKLLTAASCGLKEPLKPRTPGWLRGASIHTRQEPFRAPSKSSTALPAPTSLAHTGFQAYSFFSITAIPQGPRPPEGSTPTTLLQAWKFPCISLLLSDTTCIT
jgi:hypothetical protein